MKNFNFKKAISPVVATTLLLVVAISTVIFFQDWFTNFSSGMLTDVKLKTQSEFQQSNIETIIGNTLYIRKSSNSNLTIRKVEIGGNDCNISNFTSSNNLIKLDISYCIKNLSTSMNGIVVFTNNKIIEKTTFIKKTTPNETPQEIFKNCIALDSIQLNHSQSYNFFNSSSDSTCTSQKRTCNNGTLNGNNSFNKAKCNILSSSLTCTTDKDKDGQISYTCAKYPMINKTNEGNLDINDNNPTIIDNKCWLKGDKSTCEDNLIINGCGTGTVLDTGTNLCWQRDMNSAGTKTWENAKTYCNNLNLGGKNDWYLPSRQELFSITDLSRFNPAIIGGNNNKFANMQNNYYWTSTSRGYDPPTSYAWYVLFRNGDGSYTDKTNGVYVVCVRQN